jgi:hypothetical protein
MDFIAVSVRWSRQNRNRVPSAVGKVCENLRADAQDRWRAVCTGEDGGRPHAAQNTVARRADGDGVGVRQLEFVDVSDAGWKRHAPRAAQRQSVQRREGAARHVFRSQRARGRQRLRGGAAASVRVRCVQPDLRSEEADATIYFDNASSGPACASTIAAPSGRSTSVDIPSGELRLNREFDLTSTTPITILLDFDGDRSVRDTGNGRFMMTPVIAIVSVQ